jgi:hypothetical protein
MEDKQITIYELILKIQAARSLLWKKKIILLVSILMGGTLGLIYSIRQPIQYVSNSEIGLYDQDLADILTEKLKDNKNIETALLSEVQGSKETFAQKFIEIYKWDKHWEKSKMLSSITFKHCDVRNNFSSLKDSILYSICQKITEMIKVKTQGNTIRFQLTTQDYFFSKFFPQRLILVATDRYIETKTKHLKHSVFTIQQQIDSVKNVLYSSLNSSDISIDEVLGLFPTMVVKRVAASKDKIDVQLTALLLVRLLDNLELAKMRLIDYTPVIEVFDSSRIPLEIKKTGKLSSIILFGFGFGLVTTLYLLVRRFIQRIMREG